MDVKVTDFQLSSVFLILFSLFFKDAFCQVYSWSVAVPLNISVCSNSLSNPLTLDWTYTPATPDPLFIEWSKQGTGSTFTTIATYNGGNFTPRAPYAGRISRTGSTAEIAIQGPLTAADGGVYQVTVTSNLGNNLPGIANVILPVVNGPISASCVETAANVYTVTCSVNVSPPVTLQLKNGTVDLDSASSASGLSKTLSDAHNQTFQCSVTGQGSECVTLNSADVTCISAATPPDPCDSDCAWYPVIILVVLLVLKIATDVIFVAYRWGDKCKQIIDNDRQRNILNRICFIQGIINSICGVTFIIVICLAYPKCLREALAIAALVISIIVLITGVIYIVMFLCICFSCKQITDTDRQRHILYWICFIQGIINSICGVTFFIVICLAYPNCLGDGLPIAVLVLCIIVLITGVINIVMCLCCCCCPQSSDPGKPGTCGMCAKPDDPSPWLCCCRGTVQPGHTSSPDHPPPSSLPPIPPSMASPRKPVTPSSTTPRTLPSPTSDPASDSAVNPTVLLEPLSVEEPKKKKKKRKKRKNKNEAEGESSNQLKNPTGDSDE